MKMEEKNYNKEDFDLGGKIQLIYEIGDELKKLEQNNDYDTIRKTLDCFDIKLLGNAWNISRKLNENKKKWVCNICGYRAKSFKEINEHGFEKHILSSNEA